MDKRKVICGIYKITSPSGKIYIGQSVDFKKRKYMYSMGHCEKQPRLFNSLNKYGFHKHVIEFIEECEFDSLNDRERYWQEHYNVIGKMGLNCSYVNTSEKKFVHSEESILKMKSYTGDKHNNFGRRFSDEVNKSKGRSGKDSYWYGKKLCPIGTRKRMIKRSNKVKIIKDSVETIFECVRDCADYLGCTTKNVLYRDKCRISGRKSIGKYKDIYIEILK